MSQDTENAASKPLERKSEKRKRSALPDDEIEVDVNLPEPPSKKALRKAKKQKVSGKSESESKKEKKASKREHNGDEDLLDESEDDEESPPRKSEPPKPVYSIWIANLPFAINKAALQKFLIDNAQPPIPPSAISRLHMPAPPNARASQTKLKPQNKGFAYVDFSDQQSFTAALALTETPLGGRNVLIKDAKNFEGRPQEAADKSNESKTAKAWSGGEKKQASRRVFVGNLGFDVTKEDLSELYTPCGEVADIHMATFEDTGKCKGFAWVTFTDVSAAEAAVRGWTKIPEKPAAEEESEPDVGDEQDPDKAPKKKVSMRKWFVNRMQGRTVRCEYAEDPSVRYKKRFGKESRAGARPNAAIDIGAQDTNGAAAEEGIVRNKYGIAPGASSDANMRRGRNAKDSRPPKKELPADVKYRTGGITASTGTKVTFD